MHSGLEELCAQSADCKGDQCHCHYRERDERRDVMRDERRDEKHVPTHQPFFFIDRNGFGVD